MNLQDIGTVFGMIVVALGGAGTAGKYYAESEFIAKADPAPYDHVYVLVASQNLKLLYDAEDELEVLQRKVANGTATSEDRERIATLKERVRHLQEAK